MKKVLSLLFVSLLVFSTICFSGCGAINKTEVSILWSGDSEVKVPNSLINSMERAMYIENIDYTHYGANMDGAKQLEQVQQVLNKGCSVLVVELVSSDLAQDIVNAAKAKSVPVIFFNCTVKETVVKSYDKCTVVTSDIETVSEVQGEMIADYIKANFASIDKNEDGKISYVAYGMAIFSTRAVEKANEFLATKDYQVKTAGKEKINTSIEFYDAENTQKTLSPLDAKESQLAIMSQNNEAVEIIVTESDSIAFDVLLALQEKDYNTNKLKTQSIPIFTLDESMDYKAYVVAGRPEIDSNLLIKEGDSKKVIDQKNKEIKKIEELKKYYEQNIYLVDLTTVNESDLDEMIYTTINVIDTGRIAGTVITDNDTIAVSVAKIAKNLIKGNDTFKSIVSDSSNQISIEESVVSIRFTTYTN